MQVASAEQTALPQPAPTTKRPNGVKPVAAAVHNRDDRAAGLMLNDAQIASIKTRLHLTPDQEQMWPAVEAALRNIAYTRSRDARRHGAPANTQVASADADGVDVRDLKAAAVPLIMSFNSEQKDEVRNLAHVMGLDQLATQF
jgi:zinc resistance-associated protein